MSTAHAALLVFPPLYRRRVDQVSQRHGINFTLQQNWSG